MQQSAQIDKRPTFRHQLPESIRVSKDLYICRTTAKHINFLFDLLTDAEVKKYLLIAKEVQVKDDVKKLIDMFDLQWAEKRTVRYVIVLHDAAIGHFGVWPDSEPGTYATASALLKEHRGNGIANSVRNAVSKILMGKNQATKLISYVDEPNHSSIRMLLKAGYVPTDHFREDGDRKYEKLLAAKQTDKSIDLNTYGQVTRWPKDKKQRLLVLDHLYTKFDPKKTYHEQEVNELLKQWHTFQDWPMLRRELIDRHYLSRNISGTEYTVNKIA